MDIKSVVDTHEVDYEYIKRKLGHDTCKKVGAILGLPISRMSSIAHSKMVLRTCEDMLEKCSLTLGTKADA